MGGDQHETKANNNGTLTPSSTQRNTKGTNSSKIPSNNPDDRTHAANIHASPGSMSHMMGLFAPPLAPTSPTKMSSTSSITVPSLSPTSESAPLLEGYVSRTPQSTREAFDPKATINDLNKTPVSGVRSSYGGLGGSNYDVIGHDANSNAPKGHVRRISAATHSRTPSVVMPSISESKAQQGLLGQADFYNSTNKTNGNHSPSNASGQAPGSCFGVLERVAKNVASSLKIPTTYIGSFVYVLYHVVFCLALGSAIMRPNSSVSILGLMTKTAALGTLAASPIYWYRLSHEIPALYPTADLFLAAFLAKLAAIVDQTLSDDPSVTKHENDAVFLASFGVLTTIGTAMSACLILAAGVFRLANLGSYLPFPVICGFFSAVGIMTWTLAINVDTGGQTIEKIIGSHDSELVRYALLHHIPTIVVAGFMKYLGPKNPFYVCLVVVVTITLFYVFMFVTGTTLEEMKEDGWFWSHDELVYEDYSSTLGFDLWAPPAPLGVPVVIHQVHWGAVQNGMSTAVAMSFLYLIRCSV